MSSFFKNKQYRKPFPASEGEQARREGIQQALDANPEFKVQYRQYILAMPPDTVFQNEMIRDNWKGAPAKPQHWGANVEANILNGLLEHMPDEVAMTSKKSHAKRTHLIRRTHLLVPNEKPKRARKKKPT